MRGKGPSSRGVGAEVTSLRFVSIPLQEDLFRLPLFLTSSSTLWTLPIQTSLCKRSCRFGRDAKADLLVLMVFERIYNCLSQSNLLISVSAISIPRGTGLRLGDHSGPGPRWCSNPRHTWCASNRRALITLHCTLSRANRKFAIPPILTFAFFNHSYSYRNGVIATLSRLDSRLPLPILQSIPLIVSSVIVPNRI